MKIQVFSVYDSKAEIWGQPQFILNKGTALRAWEDLANDMNSNVGKHPADYTFFQIGEWDDEAGQIKMLEAKINLGTAIEFVGKQQVPMTKINNNYNPEEIQQ